MRRLPVYLLLDHSWSMSGKPIESVNEGLDTLVGMLRQDPFALETVFLSVIEFGTDVHQTVPLTDLMSFQPPRLKANGTTSLGAALTLAAERIKQEVSTSSADRKGDWRPLIFVFTDGRATDDLARGVKSIQQVSYGTLVGCAAGEGADTKELEGFASHVVRLDSNSPEAIRAFFQWVSASVAMTSQSIESGTSDGSAELPAPPAELTVINLKKD